LSQREPVYRPFAWQVDTTRTSVPEAAPRVGAVDSIRRVAEPEALYLPMGTPAGATGGGTVIVLGSGWQMSSGHC
jgi:hypothetical protein